MKYLLTVLATLPLLLQPISAASVASKRAPPIPYKVQTPPLDTDWTYKVGTNPWPEHPRPQLKRDDWESLNGIWTYQGTGGASNLLGDNRAPTGDLDKEIMIPSCIESGLSGVQDLDSTNMWFARRFKVKNEWRGRKIVMNFEAVDYEATVYINGIKVGSHTGGYWRFTVDIGRQLKFDGQDNNL